MNKDEEIYKNIIGGRYCYLLAFVFLMLLNQLTGFANSIVIVAAFLFPSIMLFLNARISDDNIRFIAIIHMISIVGMVGVYGLFSEIHDRLSFFLNFATEFSCGLSVYGWYFGVRENR